MVEISNYSTLNGNPSSKLMFGFIYTTNQQEQAGVILDFGALNQGNYTKTKTLYINNANRDARLGLMINYVGAYKCEFDLKLWIDGKRYY